jgi:hypothetical protein
MQTEFNERISIGKCQKCGRDVKVKPSGLAVETRLVCRCGYVNTFHVEKEVLLKYGRIRPATTHDPYQMKGTSLYTLLRNPDAAVSINPYVNEDKARSAFNTIIKRVTKKQTARPFTVELIQNVELAIHGLLEAPYFIFVGVTNYSTLKNITSGLNSDCPIAGAGGEWEVWSAQQGDYWRGSNWARLLDRCVFLSGDVCHRLQSACY